MVGRTNETRYQDKIWYGNANFKFEADIHYFVIIIQACSLKKFDETLEVIDNLGQVIGMWIANEVCKIFYNIDYKSNILKIA